MTVPMAFFRACLVLQLVSACSLDLIGAAPASGGAAGAGATAGGFGGDGASAGAPLGGSAGDAPAQCGAGQSCVPQAPAGWSYGLLALDAFSTAPGPTCPDGATPQPFGSAPTSASACAPCQCGPLQGGACTVPLLCGENATCASPQSYTRTDGDCVGKTGSPSLSCMLGAPTVVTPGACAPSGGGVTAADPFQQRASLCLAKSGAACGEGGECVPQGKDAYAGTICIYSPGERGCPSDYPVATLIYQKHIDQRKCSVCTCTPGTVTCVADYRFYDDMLCAGGGQKVASTACSNVSGTINDFWAGWSYQKTGGPVMGGTCVSGGGSPSGHIVGDPNAAITVCCRSVQVG